MILSMTGFARREIQGAFGTLSCELRSLNHRYLELSLRLPEDLRQAENVVREKIQQQLRRGKVDATLRWTPPLTGTQDQIDINENLVVSLYQAGRQIASAINIELAASAFDYLKWPGVIQAPQIDQENLLENILSLTQDTLKDLADSRAREGAKLREILLQRLDAIEQIAAEVKTRIPVVQAEYRQRLAERLAELRDKIDPARLEQEIVLFATRSDVAEELDRLGAHVAEVRRILNSPEAAGRRLDFMMQEFNREANTLGSKSADVQCTQAAVSLKVLIEQMREQVQNIE